MAEEDEHLHAEFPQLGTDIVPVVESKNVGVLQTVNCLDLHSIVDAALQLGTVSGQG